MVTFLLLLQVLSPNAIAVRVPPASMPGEVDITLLFRASGAQFCVGNPGKFLYTGESMHLNHCHQ